MWLTQINDLDYVPDYICKDAENSDESEETGKKRVRGFVSKWYGSSQVVFEINKQTGQLSPSKKKFEKSLIVEKKKPVKWYNKDGKYQNWITLEQRNTIIDNIPKK